MARWWETRAARWDREQQALADAGIAFVVSESARKAGRLVLDLTTQWNGQPLRLVAHFPTAYPYFPPMVIANDLNLSRHQTPGSKQLCLLKKDLWEPETDTLASLLTTQLSRLHASQPGGAEEHSQGNEAEPVTAYLLTEDNSFVGFPAYDLAKLPAAGKFRIGVESLQPLRGTVLEVLDDEGHVLFASEARDAAHYTKRRGLISTGRWVRLPERPSHGDEKHFYQVAIKADATLATPLWQSPGPKTWRADFVALLFGDELSWQELAGNAILVSKIQDQSQEKKTSIQTRLHRMELESRANYFQRDRSSADLQKGCVALVGAGSVGSPVAKFLAQSGIGDLRIIDHDVLDAGNAIRWELGRSQAGLSKARALHNLIEGNWPFTKVNGIGWRVGDANHAADPREPEHFEQLFRGVTCLVDATASTATTNFLADMARDRGVSFVWMYATHGAWAGLVGRAGIACDGFCWMCHLHYLEDQTIPPLPAAPEEHMIQPPGCLDATFVGSQVDLVEVSLMGTRLVMDEVLTKTGGQDVYRYDWNVAVLELRDAQGRPQLPKWKPYALARHPKCRNH